MINKISSDLGLVNPNLLEAANKANLTPVEKNIINQYTAIALEGKELNKLDPAEARKRFRSLEKKHQEQIVAVWGERDYSTPDESFLKKASKFVPIVALGKVVAQPVLELEKKISQYDRARTAGIQLAGSKTNIPLVQSSITKWDGEGWNKAYDGKANFNELEINRLVEQYGPSKIKVMKHVVSGLSLGEMLQLESDETINEDIINTYNNFGKNVDEYKMLFKKTKLAQYSIGRNAVNSLYSKYVPEKDGNIIRRLQDKSVVASKNITSGFIDALVLVFSDPTSYYGGVIPRVLTKAGKIDKIFKAADVPAFFKNDSVKNLWDKDFGPLLKDLKNAPTAVDRVNVRKKIGYLIPEYQNTELQDWLVNNKVFDAKSAEKFFSANIQDFNILNSGSVEGLTMWRNGIPLAKRTRQTSAGIRHLLDATFNPSIAVDSKILEARKDKVYETLLKYGKDEDFKATGGFAADLLEIEKDVSTFKTKLLRFSKAMSYSPQGRSIIYGADAVKSVKNVRLLAQQLYSKELASVIAEEYPRLSTLDQMISIRQLYAGVMIKAGASEEYIATELARLINPKGTFSTFTDMSVASKFKGAVSPYTAEDMDNTFKVTVSSSIHPYQLADAISPLNIKGLLKESSTEKFTKGDLAQKIMNAFPVIGRSKTGETADKLAVTSQLAIRLGMRSAVEESVFLGVALPASQVKTFATLKGKRYANYLNIITGSIDATGPLKRVVNRMTGTGYAAIDDAERMLIPETLAAKKTELNAQIAKQYGTTPKVVTAEDIKPTEIIDEILRRARGIVGDSVDPRVLDDIDDLIRYNPDSVENFASSISSSTMLDGRIAQEKSYQIFSSDALDKTLKELGGTKTKDFRKVNPLDTNPSQITFIHKSAINARLGGNNVLTLQNGKTFDPAVTFFTHDGLKNDYNFRTAKEELLQVLDAGNLKSGVLKHFIERNTDTGKLRLAGRTDVEIAEIYIDRILIDMHDTFHGSTNGYNDLLFRAVVEKYNNLVKNSPKQKGKWGIAVKAIDHKEFAVLTKDNRPMYEMNSQFDFDPKNWIEKLITAPEYHMTQMDRTMNGITRQPAVLIGYTAARDLYRQQQFAMARAGYFNELKNNPKLDKIRLAKKWEKISKEHFTKVAADQALNTLLKYVDNPSVQSNFAVSARYLSRYYRAGEDFNRRFFRLISEKGPQVAFRMRLVFQGMEPSGIVLEDEKGEPYFVFPTDEIINSAINPLLKMIGASPIYGNLDITSKFSSISPGLTAGSSAPALSNMTGMLSLKLVQSILNLSNNTSIEKVGEQLDDFFVGNPSGDLEWRDIVLNGVAKTLYDVGDVIVNPETSQRIASALKQAIAYDAANRVGLPEAGSEALTAEKKKEWLDNITVATRNLVVLNLILNRATPLSAQLRDTKSLSLAAKTSGMVTINGELFDLVEAIRKVDPTVSNAYEQAFALWTAENPGKAVYSISRDSKEVKVLLSQTKEFKDWTINNKSFVKTYAKFGTAYIFAPHTGKFDSKVYTTMVSLGLIEKLDVKTYLDNVLLAEDRVAYDKLESDANEKLAKTIGYYARQEIITKLKLDQDLAKIKNPLLPIALKGRDPGVEEEKAMYQELKEITASPNSPITSDQRINMNYAIEAIDKYNAYINSPNAKRDPNFSQEKEKRNAEVRQTINAIMLVDSSVREANRSIFQKILK